MRAPFDYMCYLLRDGVDYNPMHYFGGRVTKTSHVHHSGICLPAQSLYAVALLWAEPRGSPSHV